MRSTQFGLGVKYDDGNDPSVAINRNGTILEVHKNEAGNDLYRRVGKIRGATVDWGPPKRYEDSGRSPGCALNVHDVAVEVHKNNGTTLFYRVGKVSGNGVTWGPSDDYDSGVTPDVDLNDGGTAVEVHCTESPISDALYYRVGPVQGEKIDFGKSQKYAERGKDPKVSVNNSGRVVVVHNNRSGDILYRVGQVRNRAIDFPGKEQKVSAGDRADVALLDDGLVTVVWEQSGKLKQRTGRVQGADIVWNVEATQYDKGSKPAVAAAGTMAVEVHTGQSGSTLWFCTSLVTDRASWLGDRAAVLGNVPLRGLVLPAAHDAGMYESGLVKSFAQTQDLTIYKQLSYGVRYFDLRPKWTGTEFVIDHGHVSGPPLATVLADVRKFAEEGHRELLILNFSHFEKEIPGELYIERLVPQIEQSLGRWMYKSLPAGKRLADVTLAQYTAAGPAILVVVGDGRAIDTPKDGFWYYRDADSKTASKGDLRVYDEYSETKDAQYMEDDQRRKFEDYDGFCHYVPKPGDPVPEEPVPCDLFLLSWTLTPVSPTDGGLPPYQVDVYADDINPILGRWLADLAVRNRYGQIINLVYVDYVEWARVTDVVILQNEAVAASGARAVPAVA